MINYYKNTAGGELAEAESFSVNCWINLVNPTDDECEDIIALTGVPEDMLKAALDEEERARSEFDDGFRMYMVDCPIIEEGSGGDTYTTLPLAVIYGNDCVITVSLKSNAVLNDFCSGRRKVDCAKPLHFALTFMLGNAVRFLYCLKQIDRKNQRIQSLMGRNMKNADIIQLLDLQNALVYFSTSLNSNERVHEKLFKAEGVSSVEEYADLYDDLSIENRQAIETCNIYKNILSVTMDAYGSVISNNSNDSMKTLTIITILLAVPTMIAGFWGMNMPVPFQSGYGFWETGWFWLVMLAAIALTSVIALLMFKGNPFRKRAGKNRKKRRRKRDE